MRSTPRGTRAAFDLLAAPAIQSAQVDVRTPDALVQGYTKTWQTDYNWGRAAWNFKFRHPNAAQFGDSPALKSA